MQNTKSIIITPVTGAYNSNYTAQLHHLDTGESHSSKIFKPKKC
jgi:hypothetical protein